MQTILVAIKDAHRRRTVVQAVREAQPGAGIREVSTLEDIPSLVQAVQPDVLITALDSERHATLRLLDDMHVLCPQVSCVVVCRMEDFELVRNAATRAGTVDFVLLPLQTADIARVLAGIEERTQALREASADMPAIDVSPSPAQREAEALLAAWASGRRDESTHEALLRRAPHGRAFLLCARAEAGVEPARLEEWLRAYLRTADDLLLAHEQARALLWALVYPAGELGAHWLRARLEAAAAHMRYGEHATMSVGVSEVLNLPGDGLDAAAEQAQTALSYRFFAEPGRSSIVFAEDLMLMAGADVPYLHAVEEALYEALCARSMPRIEQETDALFMHLNAWPRPRPARVMRYVNRLIQQLLLRAGDDGALPPQAVQRGTAQAPALFGTCERLDALKGCVLTVLHSALRA